MPKESATTLGSSQFERNDRKGEKGGIMILFVAQNAMYADF